MFGAADGQTTFNVPVVCGDDGGKVSSQALNGALQSLAGQLNGAVSPILKNFDKETGKLIRIRCGSTGPTTVTCDNPLDWSSNVSSAMFAGSAWTSIGIHPEKKYFYGTINIANPSTNGRLDILAISSSTDLPTSSTVVGTISATELRTVVTDWMMVSPDGRTVAVAKGGTPTTLQLVDVTDHKNPTLLGNVSTSIDIGNAMQPVWLSRSSYLLIPVSSAVLIIDVSDLNDPLEVGTIVVADSDLTFMRACKTNRAETTLYIAGKGGVEAWDISKITAPTQVSSVGTGTKTYVDIALNESADWLAIVLQTSSINVNVTTVDISTTDSAVITLNTSNDIAGSYSAWGSFKEIVGQNDAIAAITTAISGNARFVVFDLSDLTAVTIDNDFDIDGLDASYFIYRINSTQGTNFNRIWIQQGVEAILEVFKPALINNKIPCQLEISRIRFNVAALPCVGQLPVIVGLPAGHPTIQNFDAQFLQGFEPFDFAKVDHVHSFDFDDATFRVVDNGDSTKELAFEVSGVTAGTVRTLTIPDASGTIALLGSIDHGADLTGLGDDDHPQYLLADGSRALSANWDAGSFKITAEQLAADIATGTAPLIIASTTKVVNLNVDLLDDQTGTYYLDSANFSGTNWGALTDAGATTLHKHDHGGMDGLGDDDHTIYALADGSRDFTATVTIAGGNLNAFRTGTSGLFLLTTYDTNDAARTILTLRKSSSSTEVMQVTADGEVLGRLEFDGVATGSTFRAAAFIEGQQDGAAASTKVPGVIIFATSPGTGSATERMRIDASGAVLLKGNFGLPDGITAPSAVVGTTFLYVDTADGDLKVKFGDGTVKTLATDT